MSLNLKEKIDYGTLAQSFGERVQGIRAQEYTEAVFDFLKYNSSFLLKRFVKSWPNSLKGLQRQLQKEYGRSTVLCYKGFMVIDPEVSEQRLSESQRNLRSIWEKGEGHAVTCRVVTDRHFLSHWSLVPNIALQFAGLEPRSKILAENHGLVLESHIPVRQIVYMHRIMAPEVGGRMGVWAAKEQEVVVMGPVASCKVIKKL